MHCGILDGSLGFTGMMSLSHAARFGANLYAIKNTAQNDCEQGDPAYDTNDRKDEAAPRHSFHSHAVPGDGAAIGRTSGGP